MNPCRLDWQTEFTDQIDDLLRTQAVQNLKYYSHHHRVTRYEHVLLVAQLSFRIARAWGLDSRAVARSALLHDLYHAWLVNAVDTLTAFVDVLGCNGKLRKRAGLNGVEEQVHKL